MTKALERILSREFEARDARLQELEPESQLKTDRSVKRILRCGGQYTADEYKSRYDSLHEEIAREHANKAYKHETRKAIANAVNAYLERNAYVVSSTIQSHIDALCGEKDNKRDIVRIKEQNRRRSVGYEAPLKYETEESESANPSRNPYFKQVVNYMPLSEAVRLAAGLGKDTEVNTKGNKNSIIFFKDRNKMLQALKRQIKDAPRKVKMQFNLKL